MRRVAACAATFLLLQVDIYASRDRLTWTPRPDQWMPLHEAARREVPRHWAICS